MIQMILTGLLCGALLGFVMQRGRFCLTGGFRDMYIAKDNRMFYALLIAIAVQSIGVYTLIQMDVIQFSTGAFPWVAVIIGSFVFGIGIILAGGCATGTWYRAGEGLLGSWMALAGYMLMSTIMKSGPLTPVNESISSVVLPKNSIADTTGISVWVFIAIFTAIVVWIISRELRKPKIVIPSMKPKRTGIAHLLFEKRWHPFFTAMLVGLIAILAWPLSEATGRMSGLGITTPSANILQYLVTGDVSIINWGVFLVLGIFLGSFIAAKGSREFRFRMPDAKTGITSFIGGILMGFGASLAGGCSIGNGLVMTAMMTWQGWVSLVFMILGTWTASYFVFIRPNVKRKTAAAQSAVTTA
ncbi:YeeE/YedE family protein [Peribacillus psychrosaccharolyticus]|uniref:YeeE/YedE family protein n=1 Tax=Peribacillus psychrosaccharolyticus TaxID=1407 RepID=A0A974NR50_PERPY|nr:YeeE/YedE family protein [Peribacillus psychrosaccharolyticus]MEC2057162.1 YeeE/YedE family protein [Peribacillus psychrosaccharolyticus]MED3745084.1 YeeE/YedE family protein [Peribacillus psychrosaccharolyticus]QQT02310.1 YeeE/YedE family protein [Peribacillus psychrosaccharolyticus]